MPSTRPLASRLAVLALPVLLLTTGAGPVAASDDDNPNYTAVVSPVTAPAGASATTTLTITSVPKFDDSLGSFRATAPAGVSITSATAVLGTTSLTTAVTASTVTVNNLRINQVGQVLTLRITSSIACGESGARTWGVDGRTSRSYSDTSGRSIRPAAGSSLGVTITPCSLDVLRQPALAGTGSVITSVPADPSGASVAVRVLDGNGAPSATSGIPVSIAIDSGTGAASAVLAGTTSSTTNANGVAVFAPTIDVAANGYRLRATATGITATTSAAFDIAGVAKLCNGACGATQSSSNTTATVAATTSGGLLTLTVGNGSIDCNNAANGFYVATSEPFVFDVTQATGRTVVTIGLAAASVDRRTKAYQVCFSSPVSTFKNRAGATVAAGSAGLLPDCYPNDDDDRPKKPLAVDFQACTDSRWKDKAGNVFVRFSVPPGDPRGKI